MTRKKHFSYLPNTDEDRQEQLKQIGVASFEELVSHIPAELRAKALQLREGLSELELTQVLAKLAAKNKSTAQQASFLGGGAYRRFVPAVVQSVVSRGEFATAYTPYQPEVSQGTLQSIYEFQTAVCLLTDMDVANASMYDGPTACAEAALMACRLTDREKIYISDSVNPEYRAVTETYLTASGLQFQSAQTQAADKPKLAGDIAALIVQYPNFFGVIEDIEGLAKQAHEAGALLIVVTEPISLGLLKGPGKFQADIVVGDAQQCGNFLAFGGPSAGYLACRKDFVRQLPGRICGMTVDNRGQRAFALTLQTREQHIRRAKANSNICTNQALNALTMLVYLTMLGPEGLRELAEISLQRAHYLAEKLTAIPGVKLAFAEPFFNEFVITTPHSAASVLKALTQEGVLGGLDLSVSYPHMTNALLVAVTEMNTEEEMDTYVKALTKVTSTPKASLANSITGKIEEEVRELRSRAQATANRK